MPVLDHSNPDAQLRDSNFLSPSSLREEKWESGRGGVAFIEESDPQAKQEQTYAFTVKAVCLSECSLM